MRKILSFDSKTNGLWGRAFAIGAAIINEDGSEGARFIGRCPIEGEVGKWLTEDVLPWMTAIPETHGSYVDLLQAFFDWRREYKDDETLELVHMSIPAEAKLFLDAHELKIIGDWDGPYPLIDCLAVPGIYNSIDGYNSKHGIKVDPNEFDGGTHSPLYSSIAAAKAYWHWLHKHEA